jgi:hypothetical protein
MEYTPITLQQLNFKFDPAMEYGDNIYLLLLALPAGRSLSISSLTKDRQRFIEEVKFCCELMNMSVIEFSNDYTQIRKTLSVAQELDLLNQKQAHSKRIEKYFKNKNA